MIHLAAKFGTVVGALGGATLVATIPAWMSDAGAVAAVVVSLIACTAAVVRVIRGGLESLGDRFVRDARSELQIDQLSSTVAELKAGHDEIKALLAEIRSTQTDTKP